MKRNHFLGRLAGVMLYTWSTGWSSWNHIQVDAGPTSLIIDADTANEVDDLFAIVAALLDPNLQVVGLTSAQFHTSPLASRDSVLESQDVNQEILRLMDRLDLPHPMGSNHPLVNPWRPQPSDAASFIIEQAQNAKEKLRIAILGPCTNIATALLQEPEIAEKIEVYYLGFWHDPKQNTWSKREFNTNNDPHAVDVLLNNPNLDFHVMTATTSQHLVFQKEKVDLMLRGKGGIADYLVDRWENYSRWWQQKDPEKKRWVMWDLALIGALGQPALAEEKRFIAPHDNLKRNISVFTSIEATKMEDRFWDLMTGFIGD